MGCEARRGWADAGGLWETAVIIHHLAETIDDDGVREGFETAKSVTSVLKKSEKG
jgi:hypothetical protein